jgi:pyridoxamine 5'-phosphate oxidase
MEFTRRTDYQRAGLNEADCDSNPIQQFQRWFEEAQAADLKEPNAMFLATADAQGRPSGRVVLLKEASAAGFVFYSNYASRKGLELQANPHCALTFFWPELERQIRIEGDVEPVSREKSEAYFRERPKRSRLGALVSPQSQVLPSRELLETRLAKLETEYAETDAVPMPPHWGGYCVRPESIEFWQGRRNRLHDRIVYRKTLGADWVMARLAP